MRAALVALAALIPVGAGCHSAATGVLVDVTGAVTADQLRVTATVDGAALPATLVPATPHPLALPTSFFAELPDGARTASFDIAALAAGSVVARGVSPAVTLAAHQQPTTTVALATSLCAAGAPPSPCTGALFCDSFESESGTTFSAWSQQAVSNSGGGAANPGTGISVAVNPVCAGSHAMHAVAVGANQQAFVYETGLSLPSTTYLRAFVYLPSQPAASFDLFSFATGDASQYLQLGYDGAKLFAFRNFAGAGAIPDFATTLPTGRWICLEAAVGLDAANGSLAFFVDGAPVATPATGVGTLPAGASDSTFEAGIIFAAGDAELYLDEVAIGPARIGCF